MSEIQIQSNVAYLKKVFQKYYNINARILPVPNDIALREFGYQSFDTGWIRHIGLANNSELEQFLTKTAPAAAYCSVSYYDKPSVTPMEAKQWNGADLIFDIDAKDLDLDCRKDHAVYVCGKCNSTSQTQNICCGTNQKQVSLPCDACIGMARQHANILVKTIVDMFGADPSTVRTYFSGHEGYHIHVTDDALRNIESYGRGKMVKYVAQHGINVDASVTTDISRIFRMPGTLNAKSGMAKIECADPLIDGVVLGDEMTTVHADCPIPFVLKGRHFGPYFSEKTDIPEYAATYMILKGLARINT